MGNPEVVQVAIYDAPIAASSSCACGCGGHHHDQHGHDQPEIEDPMAKISMEFQAQALALTLEAAFPGKVRVEYINVLHDPRGPSLPQTMLLCSGAYPTPLVYLNGQGRFAGSLPVERLREEVAGLLTEA